jgi:hypothetical protein
MSHIVGGDDDSDRDEKFAARFSSKYEGLQWVDFYSKMPTHSSERDCAVLLNLGGQTARKQETGKGWAYCLLGMYDGQCDQSKDHLENDPKSYELYEMQQYPDFMGWSWSTTRKILLPGLRLRQENGCKSLGQLSVVMIVNGI